MMEILKELIGLKSKVIKLREINYEIIRNDNDCFNQAEVSERIKETNYFDDYE